MSKIIFVINFQLPFSWVFSYITVFKAPWIRSLFHYYKNVASGVAIVHTQQYQQPRGFLLNLNLKLISTGN